MPSYETSLELAASREEVWRVLSDVAHWPIWLPTMTRITPLDGPSLRVGASYRVEQPKLRPATWVVTALDAPSRFAWEVRSAGVRIVADHVIRDLGPGSSQVTLRVTSSGLVGAPIGWLTRRITRDYIAREAAALRDRLREVASPAR